MSDPLPVIVFSRHNLSLHALLLENQPWFSARDVGRLMGFHLNDRVVNKLDSDQRRLMWIEYFREPEQHLLISESGVYALLVYHYVPGNRLLRKWLTNEVVPTLRDAADSGDSNRPMLSLLDWPEMSLSLLHWQDEGWIRLRDMPYLLNDQPRRRTIEANPWWRRVVNTLQLYAHSLRSNHRKPSDR